MSINLKRISRFGWQGFSRNKSLTAQVISVMIIGVFVLTFLFLFRQVSSFLITEAQNKVDISVYFKEGVTEDRILEVKKEVLSFAEEVKSVDYISKEQAQQVFIERHEDDELYMEALDQIEGNPFLASLNISAKTPDQYAYISSFLEEEPYAALIEKVSYNRNRNVIEKLFGIASNVEKTGIALSILFAILVGLITFNTIKLTIFSSKREISTRKLVGASNWFIRGPFMVQGALYALFSVLIFDIIFFIFIIFLNSQIKALLLDFNLLNSVLSNAGLLILIQLGFSLFLGVVSSLIATRAYLRV